jgi:hypothetical protein
MIRQMLAEFLKSGGSRGTVGSHTRLRDGLVVDEIGLVVILLAGAGLLLRSYVNVMSVDPGFAHSTVSLRVDLDARYQPQQFGTLFRRLTDKIGSLPGIQEVGAIDGLPLTPYENLTVFSRRWLCKPAESVGLDARSECKLLYRHEHIPQPGAFLQGQRYLRSKAGGHG